MGELAKRRALKPNRSIRAGLIGLALALVPMPALAISTETPSGDVQAVVDNNAEMKRRKSDREKELASLTRDIELSADRQSEIEREIALIDRDRKTLNRNILKAAEKVQVLEADLVDTERRLRRLGDNEDVVRASLAARKDILAEVLATLQRIGQRPPPALAVRPSDALAAVRSAILLNAVMPDLRTETEALAEDLAELSRLKSVISKEKKRLQGNALRHAEEQSRLRLLLSAKKRQRSETAEQLAAERQKAQELAEQAGSLRELIAGLEEQIDGVRRAAEEARLAAEERKKRRANATDPFADPGRLHPAIAFADARTKLPLPVAGELIRDYGQQDEFGSASEGQSIETRPGSRVTSPADGWVAYSGPFRSFGQLLILNTGDGYHVLLAGMERIDVALGQFVLAGEPVGIMGQTKLASASTIGLGTTRPILYVEFRKDGSAIDPTPWWARTEEEKVRG